MAAPARRRSLLGAIAVLLTGLGTWLVWGLSTPNQPVLPVPPTVHDSGPPPSAVAGKAAAAGVPASPPVRIVIPSSGVNAPVIPEGLDQQHALEIPPLSAPNLAGWYEASAKPGQLGPAVIAGHVDSTTGPSVFFNLRYLVPGDTIFVVAADRHTVRFTVTWVEEASKTTFPTQAVYGYVPYPALRLVTCGGPFDSATGHYQDNIIVYAAAQRGTR